MLSRSNAFPVAFAMHELISYKLYITYSIRFNKDAELAQIYAAVRRKKKRKKKE
jgi:hypothetical protein